MEKKHTVSSYDQELINLRKSVINMANLVLDLLDVASLAIKNQSQSFVQVVDTTDKKINEFDHAIENLSINVIALRQPMAVDLREVISSLKLAVILERMGDLSKKISHRFEYLPVELEPEVLDSILNMNLKVKSSLASIIKAYENLDVNLGAEVSREDHIIDEYYNNIMLLLEKEIQNNSTQSKYLLNVVVVVRNLERLGDYISKIAYIINYIVTGSQKMFA